MLSVTYPFPLAERKQVSLHILLWHSHQGGTGDRGVLTASSPPSTNPPRRKQFTSSTPTPIKKKKPSLSVRSMLGHLNLLLLPCLSQGIPHPPVLAISTKSCGCISDERRQALSLVSPHLSMSKEEERQQARDLSMVDCRSRCSHSPFFAFFGSQQLKQHIESEQDGGHNHSAGFCICGTNSSSPEPCSDAAATIPVFCNSPPADSSEGQRPDYSMMALVLLSIAITAIGLTGARAVWQARRRRLRQAKENDSQKRSSLATTIAIAPLKVIVPGRLVGTPLGKGSLSAGVGKALQDQVNVRQDRPININERADKIKS